MAVDQFMPIPAIFWETFPEAKKFLVGYPRSGSRWMRLIFTDLVISGEGGDPNTIYESQLRREDEDFVRESPSISRCPDVYRPAPKRDETGAIPLVFRAHCCEEILGRESTRVFSVVRRPEGMLESYWNFARSGNHLGEDRAEDLEASFAAARLEEWNRWIEGILGHARATPDRVRVGLYEEGRVFSSRVVESFLQNFGIEFPSGAVVSAVDRFRDFIDELNRTGKFGFVRGGDMARAVEKSPWWHVDQEIRERAESLCSEAESLASR